VTGALRRAPGRSARRGAASGEDGATLVELLVAMSLTAVVLAAVTAVFVSSTRSVRETQVRTSTQADARTALEAMSRSLRVAVVPAGSPAGTSPFVSATPTSVSFYANLQRTALTYSTSGPTDAPAVHAGLQAPTLVTYAWDAGLSCVTESQVQAVTSSTGSYSWPGVPAPKCLARTTGAPAFTYYPSGLLSASGTTAPTTADLARVVSVGVQLEVRDPAAPDVGAAHASDRVTLVNVLAAKTGAT